MSTPDLPAFVYPVSLRKFVTAVLRNLLGMSESGDMPVSPQPSIGHMRSALAINFARTPVGEIVK